MRGLRWWMGIVQLPLIKVFMCKLGNGCLFEDSDFGFMVRFNGLVIPYVHSCFFNKISGQFRFGYWHAELVSISRGMLMNFAIRCVKVIKYGGKEIIFILVNE